VSSDPRAGFSPCSGGSFALQLQQTVLVVLFWAVNQVSSPSRTRRRRSRQKHVCLNLKTHLASPLRAARESDGGCIIIRICVRLAQAPDERRGNSKRRKSLASPPRSLRGQQPNLPCRSQRWSSRTSYPTDQQLPHDQAVRQLVRKWTFIISYFFCLLDVALFILFSRDSCRDRSRRLLCHLI